jgi:hypothetical protein
VKTEKDLPAVKRNAYLKALSALEMKNYGLVSSLLGPLVAEEPEFFTARKLLREAQIQRSKGKSSFLGLSGSGISLGRGKVKKLVEAGDWNAAFAEAEKALESDPTGAQPNKELHDAAEAAASAARQEVAPLRAVFDGASDEAKEAAARQLDAAQDKVRTYESIACFALETIANDPKNTKAKHQLGDYLMRIEEYDEATRKKQRPAAPCSAENWARLRSLI